MRWGSNVGPATSLSLPTQLRDWRLMARTTRLVLSIPAYAFLAVLAALASLSVFVLSRNLDLLGAVILFGNLPLVARLEVLVSLYPGVGNAYAPDATVLLVATAALVGIDVALVGYHLREHRLSARESSGGLAGLALGTLGAGCATCGSALLAGLLSLVGAGGALTLLPLDGLEAALIALVALVLSIYWVAEGLDGGTIRGCPVDVDGAQ